MQDEQLRQKLRSVLISNGITDEKMLEEKINALLDPERHDMLTNTCAENRVYPTSQGFVSKKTIELL